jgi:hypothetical protein
MMEGKGTREDLWLGENLTAKGLITFPQLEAARRHARDFSFTLRKALIHLRTIREGALLAVYAEDFGMEILNISEKDFQMIDASLARLLPLKFCLTHEVLPVFRFIDEDQRELTLAVTSPFKKEVIAEVARLTGCRVTPVLTTSAALAGGVAKLY